MNDDTDPPQQETPGAAASEFGGAAEISRRVGAILDAVEREAQRLREEAREEARRYLDDANRRTDELVAQRRRRIAEISDDLMRKSEAVVGRLDDAAPVRQGFENLVRALGDAAERLARDSEASHAGYEPQPDLGYAYKPPAPPPPPTTYAAEPRYYAQPDQPASQPEPDPYGDPDPYGEPARPARPTAPGGWERQAVDPAGWRQLEDARMVAVQMATAGATRAVVRDHLHRALGLTDSTGILDQVFGAGTGEDAQVPWTPGPR